MTSGEYLGRMTVTGWIVAALVLTLTGTLSAADRKKEPAPAAVKRAKRTAVKSKQARGQKKATTVPGPRPRWHPGLELASGLYDKRKPDAKR